jgi:hypothetical protein
MKAKKTDEMAGTGPLAKPWQEKNNTCLETRV